MVCSGPVGRISGWSPSVLRLWRELLRPWADHTGHTGHTSPAGSDAAGSYAGGLGGTTP